MQLGAAHNVVSVSVFKLHLEQLTMGVSDRMATDGVLYEEWGKEGMRVLNKTVALLQGGIATGMSRYDLVLTVAQRANENALRHMGVICRFA